MGERDGYLVTLGLELGLDGLEAVAKGAHKGFTLLCAPTSRDSVDQRE